MPKASPASAGPGRTEFVLLVASVMMIVAFAIDSMLPALPAIGHSLGVSNENDRQLVVSAFLLGFGVAQLFVGTLSDRYGRRRLICWALGGFVVTSIAAITAPTFGHLLLARAVQGVFAAGARVIVVSMVRDRYEGRDMAQVMSLASMIFMAAPILAPAMGQAVLSVGPWRWIFWVLAAIGLAILLWAAARLPETLPPERRIPIAFDTVRKSALAVVTDRSSLGYGLAMGVMSCSLFGFLLSVQQVFEHTFARPDLLPTGFAVMAAGMAVASLTNAAIVKRFGMRRIGHAALMFFTGMALVHLAVAASGHESLASFIALQMAMMMGFSFVAGNFGAMAMENMGGQAGMASSLQGSAANIMGAVFGTLIGHAFDGTTVPLYAGYALCGLAALAIVWVTEGGRFFVAHHETAR